GKQLARKIGDSTEIFKKFRRGALPRFYVRPPRCECPLSRAAFPGFAVDWRRGRRFASLYNRKRKNK
ncbi:MAG TPA: hypothetical protein VN579_01585, partial [Bryobacteraceae bacterium]|nr:hypothetical protein [Bryobacteraceae bacterium]